MFDYFVVKQNLKHIQQKKRESITQIRYELSKWLRGKDLNQRPSGYEPDELPTAPPRDIYFALILYAKHL